MIILRLLFSAKMRIHTRIGRIFDVAKGFIVGEEDTNRHIKMLIKDEEVRL